MTQQYVYLDVRRANIAVNIMKIINMLHMPPSLRIQLSVHVRCMQAEVQDLAS